MNSVDDISAAAQTISDLTTPQEPVVASEPTVVDVVGIGDPVDYVSMPIGDTIPIGDCGCYSVGTWQPLVVVPPELSEAGN